MNSLYKVEWTSPSNIALVKYWGKYGVQLPQNPSISFTLKNSVTTLSIEIFESEAPTLEFFFEGKPNLKFQEKISKFLAGEIFRFPWLSHHHLKIESKNTFPHSSGIASSASSMSALCLGLLSIDEKMSGRTLSKEEFFKQASELSRLASGSAGRSVFPRMAVWGVSTAVPGSSNEYAVEFSEAHPMFHDYCDSILIVDAGEKSVSSRAGHSLMENHPMKDVRFQIARENMIHLVEALKAGDMESFIRITEEEALTLHALMMTSRPSYILLRPDSLRLIEEIKNFRATTKIPACFTIDAGPNIHLLYPKSHEVAVRRFIDEKLAPGLAGVIHDEVGMGPVKTYDSK